MSFLQYLAVIVAVLVGGPFLAYALFKMAALGIFRARKIMEQEEKNDDNLTKEEHER